MSDIVLEDSVGKVNLVEVFAAAYSGHAVAALLHG
jgi:hypothetical protein